jgi:hypothetical protein
LGNWNKGLKEEEGGKQNNGRDMDETGLREGGDDLGK